MGAGGSCLDIFSLVYHFIFLSPSLWVTARYRLKYCFKGPLSPKQPTNQPQRDRSETLSQNEKQKQEKADRKLKQNIRDLLAKPNKNNSVQSPDPKKREKEKSVTNTGRQPK